MPTILRVLKGNPGGRPLNAHEPQPDPLAEDVPEELTDPLAVQEWTRTIAPAIRTGQITGADRCLAVAHAETYAVWRSQVIAASRHAHVIAAGKGGYPMPNPARTMANKSLMLLARIDAELGLTPASRSRVTAVPPMPPSSTAERFFGK